MPKRKSPEGANAKDASKVTKQEKPAPPKPVEVKPKKAIAKKPVDDKNMKEKKGGAKVKEDGPSHNGQTMTEEICVSRSSVSVTYYRSLAPNSMSVRGQSETVRVNGD
ncbi:high mobility group nucleosome-binding domain-containing protein 3 isoform X7 [Coregonus clupeaformis]|uniref:high mobility group nucleosome-binding domain-containing protein 3 isoform X7 n=1 Tax=Coregonus clupeaformis TaxID=59861 RepID=UPI001BE0FE04|nr:high mobility group nucleosome-binding domain-containing protein 3 isoform X7 [Coregonus clupeaformis]